ncbi:hypothetical protein [Paenibacillus daejeonensis]|uniref:hypothetical protein n=1 Tax=Paenibacillus daejeonensis TaxID=135193 RepID=UPI0012FBE0A9|nr:hypothetical protein [Paenibacillus daejeonensis]
MEKQLISNGRSLWVSAKDSVKSTIDRVKRLFGGGTSKIQKMPLIVQSRINISNEGFTHVVKEHFSKKNESQFTISQNTLRNILRDKDVVNTPVTRTQDSKDGIRYVRDVTMDRPIGTDKLINLCLLLE